MRSRPSRQRPGVLFPVYGGDDRYRLRVGTGPPDRDAMTLQTGWVPPAWRWKVMDLVELRRGSPAQADDQAGRTEL